MPFITITNALSPLSLGANCAQPYGGHGGDFSGDTAHILVCMIVTQRKKCTKRDTHHAEDRTPTPCRTTPTGVRFYNAEYNLAG